MVSPSLFTEPVSLVQWLSLPGCFGSFQNLTTISNALVSNYYWREIRVNS